MTLDQLLPPLMFATLLALVFTGYPVAFSISATGMIFAAIGIGAGFFDLSLLYALPERIFGIMSNTILISIVYFVFMGVVLEKSRIAEDLLGSIGSLFGRRPGGIAVAVVLVGALLAAATGVVGATVVAMGLISLPSMRKNRYDDSLAAGVICASGTLGQIIPPSVILIVLGDQLGVSVGDLFRAAVVPGLVLVVAYIVYILFLANLRPESCPPVSEPESGAGDAKGYVEALVPPVALIAVVLGSIFAGIATPAEAGALGALGAILLAKGKGTLSSRVVHESSLETVKLVSMVVFLLIGSTFFALVFRGIYGDIWLEELATGIPGGTVGIIVAANLLVFGLGFFIDFFEICFIVIPMIAPILERSGVDMVWFGILIALNLQTSFLTPPFGPALFYLRGVAPKGLPTSRIYRGVIPFILLQLLVLGLVYLVPGLAVRNP